MSLGEMLHRLGSAIGLYPDDRAQEDFDDYDDQYGDDEMSSEEPYRASNRSTGYRTQTASSRTQKAPPRSAYAPTGGSSLGGSSQGLYDSAQPRRSTPNNVVQMPPRNSGGSTGRDSVYGSSTTTQGGSYGAPTSVSAASASSRHSEIIVYVRRKDDAQQIIGYVLEERSVILNCESIDDAQCQRVIDMLGGAAYAIGGHVQRVSHRNYLFAPANVEVSSSDSAPVSRYSVAASAAQS